MFHRTVLNEALSLTTTVVVVLLDGTEKDVMNE